jgi:16S rRNA processing protein RimM
MATPLLTVASVARTHGLRGEVLADVATDFPERLRRGATLVWRSGDRERLLTIRDANPHGSRVRLGFEGIDSIEAAAPLRGGDLCVAAADAHPAPEGFYYAHELEGFVCEDVTGRRLGTVTGLDKTAAGAILSVDVAGREALVPWTRPIVVRVDREARRIVLDPPQGLLEL